MSEKCMFCNFQDVAIKCFSKDSVAESAERVDVVSTHLPNLTESGLGQDEHENIISNVVHFTINFWARIQEQHGKQKSCTHYIVEIGVKLGKCAAEHGHGNARKHFENILSN